MWRSSGSSQHLDEKIILQKDALNDSLFQRLFSTIVLLIVLAVLGFVGFLCFQVYANLSAQTQEYLDERQIKVGKRGGGGGVSIPVSHISKDKMGNYAQRVASTVFGNTASVDAQENPTNAKLSRMLRFREWKDRKRTVYTGSATEAANSGFYDEQNQWEGDLEHS